MKKTMLLYVALMLLFCANLSADGELIALGPEPYPTGPVSFETYTPEPGVVQPGEFAIYQFSWNGIPAARAWVEVRNDPERPDYICAGGEGNILGRVAALYQAEDSISSCMNATTFKPDQYSIRIRETLTHYDMVIKFDHEAGIADRQKKYRRKTTEKQFHYTNAFCPASVFLYVRSLPWRPGDKRRFEVIDGNERYLLVVEAKEIRKIKVPAGEFRAIRLEPSIFEMPRDHRRESASWWERQKEKDKQRIKLISSFELWMATEAPRPVIKMVADVFFGKVEMNLTEFTAPEPAI